MFQSTMSPWCRALMGVLWLSGGAVSVAQDVTQTASTVCGACHGADGNSSIPMFPKLAGQQRDYLVKQLNEFISGKRKNDTMTPMVATVKSDDVAALAAYFAGQKASVGVVEDPKLLADGKKLYEDGNTVTGVPGCAGCHMPKGEGNDRYPRLAGQHPTYTRQQMADFKAGTRNNDKARVMRAVAERMTEAEMQAVSQYLASL